MRGVVHRKKIGIRLFFTQSEIFHNKSVSESEEFSSEAKVFSTEKQSLLKGKVFFIEKMSMMIFDSKCASESETVFIEFFFIQNVLNRMKFHHI